MSADKPIKGKAKRKLITQTMTLSLVNVAEKKKSSTAAKLIGIFTTARAKYTMLMAGYTASILKRDFVRFVAASVRLR